MGGLKRSGATEDHGIPLGITAAGAHRHDSPLLAPTLAAAAHQLGSILPPQPTCHLDAGTTAAPPARLSISRALPPASPAGAPPPPSRPDGAGPWNAPTPG